ncbi:STAS domain-containing protein [Rhodococcus aetherivorans]|uniref:STAS domain-containing protein n=1 Tax=Rhodococcus aetherivorans TaxID=191292 RepID=UPI00294915D7|nr:STAS domain-containing protein [Rhodococcus aetherivorans]MDV6295419.1 STAS domain-containing protein [Rhodococcus aetherivorans]
MIYQFDYVGDPRNVVIDLTGADIWDASTVATLDAIRHKYANKGKSVEIVGLDGAGLERLDRLSGRLGEGHQLPVCSPRPCGRLCVPGCFRRGGAPSRKAPWTVSGVAPDLDRRRRQQSHQQGDQEQFGHETQQHTSGDRAGGTSLGAPAHPALGGRRSRRESGCRRRAGAAPPRRAHSGVDARRLPCRPHSPCRRRRGGV